jgi:hypothetical protein
MRTLLPTSRQAGANSSRRTGNNCASGPKTIHRHFADKHALVSAEIARIEGRAFDAMQLYERAIQSARENGFVQNEGVGP